MRKEIIKILQKPNQYAFNYNHHTHYSDISTHLTDHHEHSMTLLHQIETREDLELDKLKKSIETASTRQTETLLTKLKAVQRVTPSTQKRRQCPSRQKSNKQQQKQHKLTETTYSCPNYGQNIKTQVEANVGEGREKKDYEQLLEMQIQLLSDELNSLKQQKEAINKHALSLKFQNDRLRALLGGRQAQIINLRASSEQMCNQLNSERRELQAQIYQLIAQHAQNKSKNMRQQKLIICGQIVKLSVIPNQHTQIDSRSRNMQLEFINLEKKYNTTINQLKIQHQDEIAKLRKTMFDNINYYRDLTKKSNNDHLNNDPSKKCQPQFVVKQNRQGDGVVSFGDGCENGGR